jgi:large subunit ribosomal protein L25
MAKITLSLEPRKILGKKVKTLRKQGIIPANIFGNKIESTPVQVKSTVFRPIYAQAGETQIVYVQVQGEKTDRPVLLTNISYDPMSGDYLHIDLRQVNLKEKVTANIPVELIGESPAVKDIQATLITSLDEIEVEALPTDLPDHFTADVSTLKALGDSIKVSDLNIDLTKIEVKVDPETVIVTVAGQQKEEVVAAPVIETEVIGEAKPEAGTKPEEVKKEETPKAPAKEK